MVKPLPRKQAGSSTTWESEKIQLQGAVGWAGCAEHSPRCNLLTFVPFQPSAPRLPVAVRVALEI